MNSSSRSLALLMTPVRAAILTIGDELLAGDVIDSNKAYIAAQAREFGLEVLEAWTLRDRREEIGAALRSVLGRVEVVFVSGGLGPTSDDLTTDAIAKAAQVPLLRDEDVAQGLQDRFAALGRELYESNLKQADFPEGATIMVNPRGSAPGFALPWPRENSLEADSENGAIGEKLDQRPALLSSAALSRDLRPGGESFRASAVVSGGQWVFVMPGVPYEMRPMLRDIALPQCQEIFGPRLFRCARRIYRSMGLGESEVAQRLGDSFSKDTWQAREAQSESPGAALPCPRLHYRAHTPEVLLTLDFEGHSPGDLDRQRLQELDLYIQKRIGSAIYAVDDRELVEQAATLLVEHQRSLAVAESCTGGGLGELLTQKSGASAYFAGGVMVYSDELKHRLLGVSREILREHGAVSAECADAMLCGLVKQSGCDLGIAITGIAGPGGGSEDKPRGTVFVGVASPQGRRVYRFLFRGDRLRVRRRSIQWALRLVVDALRGKDTWTGTRGDLVRDVTGGILGGQEIS